MFISNDYDTLMQAATRFGSTVSKFILLSLNPMRDFSNFTGHLQQFAIVYLMSKISRSSAIDKGRYASNGKLKARVRARILLLLNAQRDSR